MRKKLVLVIPQKKRSLLRNSRYFMNIYYYYMSLAVGKTTVVDPEPTGTSSISALPNKMSAQPNRVVLEKKELPQNNMGGPPIPPAQLTQDSINQIVLGIQQASQNDMTGLSSRDIPMTTNQISADAQVRPNFVPESATSNYIEDDSTFESIAKKNKQVKKEQDSLDSLYEELQTPIFVMVLFFLFQLPYFQKVLVRFAPSLFNVDGRIGLSGLLSKTVLFGISYYSLTKLTSHLSQI